MSVNKTRSTHSQFCSKTPSLNFLYELSSILGSSDFPRQNLEEREFMKDLF